MAPESAGGRRLDGWKAIAAYLNRSERTVLRWKKALGLPVHQAKAQGAEIVYAMSHELDAWLENLGHGGAARTQEVPARHVPVSAWLAIGAVSFVAITAFAVTFSRAERPAIGITSGSADFSDFAHDWGPWPTQGHDVGRTNQSEYLGPVSSPEARLLFDLGTPMTTGGEPREQLTVGPDGTILVGACGTLVALNAAGRPLWRQNLSERGFPISVSGVSMSGTDTLVVAVKACREMPDVRKVKLLWYGLDGTLRLTQPRAGAYFGPAVTADGTVYQMDEFNDIHAYSHGMMTWTVDLPGYLQGAVALDSTGGLYAGTDANVYGQPSLWSVDAATGRVRWSTGQVAFGTPVAGQQDIYVVDATGSLHAFSHEGHQRWMVAEPGAVSLEPLALGRSGTVYLEAPNQIVAVSPNGTVRWRVPLPGQATSPGPVVDRDENVYVAAGGAICRITSSGVLSWCLPLRGAGRLVIAGDNSLLAVSDRQRIYAVASAGG